VLNGHKIWSSRAVFADWAFGLFRSDPASERHKGLSLILFPLSAPGVTVKPIARLDGKLGFAEIFLDDVRVPVTQRIGDEGQGWNVCMATAGFERGLMLRSPARYQQAAARLVALYRQRQGDTSYRQCENAPDGSGSRLDPTLEAAVTRAWMDAESYSLSIYSTASRLMKGGGIGPEASTNKIFWSELDVMLNRTALSILGAHAELFPAPLQADVERNPWLEDYLFALAGPIYAGTNEIQRNIIAERMLGLPR
jgi:alkylation response protein AidB-like acyl-CoA dehydrogenase